MRIDIVTMFVEMFQGPFQESILKRAQESGLVEIRVHNLRDWTHDPHHKTDDEQFGGGDGMVMLAEPLLEAVEALGGCAGKSTHVILTSPQGRLFNQKLAKELVVKEHLLILCGHYKGVDQRVIDYLHPDEISIGDYVLTGGELPAMVIVDAVVRLVPGVVGSFSSVEEDSFFKDLLDCPRYTRPRVVRGLEVPPVLLSGHHAEIAQWREQRAREKTARLRPDLLSPEQSPSPDTERDDS